MKGTNAVQRSGAGQTRELVLTGILVALVFVATRFINIRLPLSINGGLIHLGNTMLFLAAILFGQRKGAIAGAFGMGLFDLVSGWVAWAPFTFVIRGVMGYLVGKIARGKQRNGESLIWNVVAVVVGGIWMIVGYYITEGLLYGNWVTPMTSVLGNVIQIIVGGVLGLPLIIALKKTKVL